jgi:hypothetical protein
MIVMMVMVMVMVIVMMFMVSVPLRWNYLRRESSF